MKKLIIVLSTSLFLLISLFTGCSDTFNWDKSIEKLATQGMTISGSFSTEEEMKEATSIINSDIKSGGGKFTVEVKRYVVMIQNDNHLHRCEFVEFATEEQAKNFANFFISTRNKYDKFKLAISDTVVVLTNLEEAQKALNLDFQ